MTPCQFGGWKQVLTNLKAYEPENEKGLVNNGKINQETIVASVYVTGFVAV